MLYSLNTALEVPLPWLLENFCPLRHVTLRKDKPLAVQLRLTFCPIQRTGGVVMCVILGRSGMAINKLKKLTSGVWINVFQYM